jgi:cation diffusion facilitator family transporter
MTLLVAEAETAKVVAVAAAANAAIVVAKLVAALASGSSAMFSEAIHSIVDTGDGLLLFIGLRLARRPADRDHPFGHGKDLYFFSFVVAMLIFGLGGGLSIREGIEHIRAPRPIENLTMSYIVLAVVALFESTSLAVAARAFRRYREAHLRGLGMLEAIHAAKDPTTFTVILEDAAALAGLAVAALGITLAHWLDVPALDGVASCVIGLILAAVAVLLGVESRGLLIGERALRWVVTAVRELAGRDPAVKEVVRAQTMMLGPERVLLALTLQFRPELGGDERARAIARIDEEIRVRFPAVRHVFVEAAGIAG